MKFIKTISKTDTQKVLEKFFKQLKSVHRLIFFDFIIQVPYSFRNPIIGMVTMNKVYDKTTLAKLFFTAATITILDTLFVIALADLFIIFQGASQTTWLARHFIWFSQNQEMTLLAFIILRVPIHDFATLQLNTVIYSIYQKKISTSLNQRLKSSLDAKVFDEGGLAVKNYVNDMNAFVGGFLTPLMNLSVDLLVILGLALFLWTTVGFNFGLVLVLGISLFFVLALSAFLSKRINSMGRLRNKIESEKSSLFTDLEWNWRSLVDLDSQSFFINLSNQLNKIIARCAISITRSLNIGKLSIETYFGLILISFLLMFGNSNYDPASLGIVVAIMLKLLPTLNRSSQSVMTIFSSLASIRSINSNPRQIQRSVLQNVQIEDEYISVKDFKFDNHKGYSISLEGIHFKKNSLNVIKAPSGFGKSVFVESLYDELKERGLRVAFLPQKFDIFNLPVEKNIYLDEITDTKRLLNTKEILKKLHFDNNKITQMLEGKINSKQLSGGERQRIFFARYIISDFDVILLDEITSALDDETEAYVLEILTTISKNTTIILATHSELNELNFKNSIDLEKCLINE